MNGIEYINLLLLVFHTPFDGSSEVADIIIVLAHALAFHVGKLGNVLTVTEGGLHDDVESGDIRVVGDVGSDTESDFCSSLEMSENIVCFFEIQTVGE